MVTRTDYNQIAVNAAYSVLIEIVRVLGEYRDNIVLIGGWVPQFLFQNKDELHTGSIDIDLALDHRHDSVAAKNERGLHRILCKPLLWL